MSLNMSIGLQSSPNIRILQRKPNFKILMLVKILIVITLIVIAISLFSALFYLMKGDSNNERVVKALTWRISLSLALFLLLMIGFYTGVIGQPNV